MSQNNTTNSSVTAVSTISPFKLAAVNESLAMMPSGLSVKVSDGWTSEGPSQVLAIRPKDTKDMKFLPVLHVSDLTEDMTPSQIAEKIVETYNEQAGLIDFSEESTSKPYVLSHVVPRLIRSDKVSAAKEAGIITEHFMGNLYICWVVIMKEEGEEQVSYSLDEKNLNSIGATLNEIKAAALRNIKGTTEIMPIEDAIGLASDEKPVGATFYVATNEHRHYGATAVLLQPEVLDEQERKLGNFHIIPSSVHEVLIVPDTLHISAPELKNMLIDVNTSIVSDKDILDDHVYRYAQGRLTVVD